MVMSITLGVYDLFAYTVPGILYLYIANEFLILFGLAHIEFQNLDNIVVTILVIIVGYILGQILDLVAKKWRKWGQPRESTLEAIEKLKKDHPKCEINFLPHDWPFLLSLIRRYHPEVATSTDRSKAISVMLQNASLGLLFYSLLQLISFLLNDYSIEHLLLALFAFIIALPAKRKSQIYNRWFYDHIYETALTYGSDTSKIIRKVQANKPVKEY
jgi:hypothetical protein